MIRIYKSFYPLGIAEPAVGQKRGAELFAAAAAAIIGSGISAMSAESVNDSNIRAATDLNKENRDWQSSEADKARAWSRLEWNRQHYINKQDWYEQSEYNYKHLYEMYERQLEGQRNEWQYQFDKTNEYNTPLAQSKRLQEAGFNPSAVLGNTSGATGMASAPSVSTPSPSSGSNVSKLAEMVPQILAGTPQTSTPHGEVDWLSKAVSQMSDAFRSLVDSGVKSSDIEYLQKSMTDRLGLALSQKDAQQLVNDAQRLDNLFQQENMPNRAKKLWLECKKLSSSVAVNEALEENYNADSDLKRLQGLFTELCTDNKVLENGILSNELLTWFDNFESVLENRRSQNADNYADAFKKRAEGVSENELRSLRADFLQMQGEYYKALGHGTRLDNWLKDETLQARAVSIVESAKQAKLITQEEAVRLSQDIYGYETRKVDKFFQWLGQGFSAYRDAGIGTSAFSAGKFNGKGLFDPDAGKGFVIDRSNGLLFEAPWGR